MYSINRYILRGLCVIFLTMPAVLSMGQHVPDSLGLSNGDTAAVIHKETKGVPLSGQIKDAASRKPLAGINISLPGYSAALSDDRGRFTISVPDYQSTLVISGQGFQRKEVPLKGQKTVSVSLYEEGFTSFYEEAVLPAGSEHMSYVPFSISSVNIKRGWQANSETPDTYLQGTVAGLNVIRRSATPGVGADLYLRGFNSLNATNQPLMIVDGMIYDNRSYGNSLIGGHVNNPLQYIDIRDIDNITLIKDAGAAIYGTKAANGVMLITTARARELATRIDFSAYGGANFPVSDIPVMKAYDYRVYLSDMLKSAGYTDSGIAAEPYMDDNLSNAQYYNYHSETNWQQTAFKPSYDNNYYLKVTGGDNIAAYALSMGYAKDQGIIENTRQSKYNTRFNADFNLAKKLTASANLSFTYNEQQLKDGGLSPKVNPMYVALVKSPFLTANVYDAEGNRSPALSDTDVFGVSNPVAIIDNVQDEVKGYRFFGAVNFNYTFSSEWKLGTLIGVSYDKTRERIFIPRAGVADDTLRNAVADSRMGSQVMRLFGLYNDTHVSFAKEFNRIHKLSLTGGIRFSQDDSEQDYALAYNSATDQLVSIGNGDVALRNLGGEIGKWRWLNNYLNADYNLSGKYVLNATLALDGSSRFGKQVKDAVTIHGVKMALLPSVSGAWLISAENFMANIKSVDLLKIRAGYGVTGNDDIGNYTARQYYVSQNLLGMQGLVRGNIANKELQWETVKKVNLGADAALFNERLSFSIDVYKNRTSHMLTYEPTTTVSGIRFYVSNNGGMETKGAEVSLNGRIINKTSLKWDAGFTLSTYRNKVTRLPYQSLETSYADATYITAVGETANLFYGYRTNGVYTSDAEAAAAGYAIRTTSGSLIPFKGGDRRFMDMNGDHVIDETDRVVIGDPNPDLFGGLSTRLAWKRWALDALMTFSYGNDSYNYVRSDIESGSNYNNQTLRINNRWRTDGQVTDVPKASWGDPMGNSRFSDQWIEDGSWIRLRTVSLSYELPLKTQSLKYVKVYFTGNNLITLTKYLGYDPEFSATGSVFTMGADTGLQPQFQSVQLGIRIGL